MMFSRGERDGSYADFVATNRDANAGKWESTLCGYIGRTTTKNNMTTSECHEIIQFFFIVQEFCTIEFSTISDSRVAAWDTVAN